MSPLCQMPQHFPFFEELYITPNKYHKMFIEKWYLVLYQIRDDTVYIDYILDCRKDIIVGPFDNNKITFRNRHLQLGGDFFMPKRRFTCSAVFPRITTFVGLKSV